MEAEGVGHTAADALPCVAEMGAHSGLTVPLGAGAGLRFPVAPKGRLSAVCARVPTTVPTRTRWSAFDGEESAQCIRTRNGDLAAWSHVCSRRDQHALLVEANLAQCRVLHDPAPAVLDIARLAAHRRRGMVADDVARPALQGAELVKGEPDRELSHQGPRAVPLVCQSKPGAGRNMPGLREVSGVKVLHADELAVPAHGQRQPPVVGRELGSLCSPPGQRCRGVPVG